MPMDFYWQVTEALVSKWREVIEKGRDYKRRQIVVANKAQKCLYTKF
jgi:hypothetical protein